MTYEQMKIMSFGGSVPPTFVSIPTVKNQFTPPAVNEFNEGLPKPLEESDFNHVPLNQMEELTKGRYSDDLHQKDSLAAQFNKGKIMKAIVDVEGAQGLANRYNVKL